MAEELRARKEQNPFPSARREGGKRGRTSNSPTRLIFSYLTQLRLKPAMDGEPISPDAATRSTDTDALVSRSSAASLGYLSDPFASLFLPPSLRRSTEKRPPLINIGTHARTWAVDALVDQFLAGGSSGKGRQVLSLGAGTDTRYWRMRAKTLEKGEEWSCKWVEVDFEEATGAKARTISGKKVLKDALGGEVKIGALFALVER